MKELFLLLIGFGGAYGFTPCCETPANLYPGGFCGNGSTRITINCTNGYFLLKDIILQGNKLSTADSPSFIFSEDESEYCIGTTFRNMSNHSLGTTPSAVLCFQSVEASTVEMSGILTIISAVFLIITFAVYMFIPQLRDLQGLCYMCLCISMSLGFFSLGLLQLNPGFQVQICTMTGFFVYFWMMATFFWMNIICINVYRTVINGAHLKGTEKKQYFIYSCYGWGNPCALLFISLVTNFVEGTHLKPGIGNYGCWFQDRESTWLFFYGPIAVLLSVNIVLFALSSINLWRHSITRNHEVSKLNNLKYKFLLSLKLFLVMGISWTFEIISFAHGENFILWRIMDIFNCLQGVIIFIILVILRRRAIKGLIDASFCLPVTKVLAEKLNPHDDSDDQQILDDDHTEVRLN